MLPSSLKVWAEQNGCSVICWMFKCACVVHVTTPVQTPPSISTPVQSLRGVSETNSVSPCKCNAFVPGQERKFLNSQWWWPSYSGWSMYPCTFYFLTENPEPERPLRQTQREEPHHDGDGDCLRLTRPPSNNSTEQDGIQRRLEMVKL